MKTLRAILGFLGASAALLVGVSSAQAGTSLSSIPNACWTTEQPLTLVENEHTKLTWDVYGNLTLINDGGNGSSISWGLKSTEPLTGSNAGKLCFGNGAGRLRIHDSTGAEVWNSGTTLTGETIYSAPNGSLSIYDCTIRIKDTNGVIMWDESLPQCEIRSRKKPTSTKCWAQSETQVVLNDEDLGNELVWEDGSLWFRQKDGSNEAMYTSGGAGEELCYNGTTGSFAVHNAAGAIVQQFGGGDHMSLYECGVEFWSEWSAPNGSNTRPIKLIEDRIKAPGSCHRRSFINGPVCFATSAWGTLLRSGFTRLDWSPDGRLRIRDSADNVLWSKGESDESARFCLMPDGNLTFYKAASSGGYVSTWSTNTGNASTVHDYALEIKGNVLRAKDTDVDALCVKREALGDNSSIGGVIPYDRFCGEGYIFGDWYGYSYRYPWIIRGSASAEPLPGGGYSYVKDWHGGNRNFGAGAWLVAGALNGAGLNAFRSKVASTDAKDEVFAALPTTGLPSNYAEAIADGGANVTLFGDTYTLVEGIASAEINNGPKDMVKVMIGGATVYSSSAFGVFSKQVPRTFFSREAQFVVGGVPINTTFEATGTVGMRGNIDYNQNSDDLTCTITPFASVDAFGSIGVGVSGFSVGVEGELQLISIGFPLINKLNTETKNYTATSDFTLSSLEGSLSLYAKALFFKATKEVASFDGYSTSTTLFKVSGSLAP